MASFAGGGRYGTRCETAIYWRDFVLDISSDDDNEGDDAEVSHMI